MPEPRKIFRIEQTAAARLPRRAVTAPEHRGEIAQALDALHAMMRATPPPPPAAAGEDEAALETPRLARIAHELDAVTSGTAQATQKILAVAEEIDQLANNLSAALKGKVEQEAAQDIADLVVRIFEACNFQDLISQRVGKVMRTLKASEPLNVETARYLHGPRLDGDNGHMSQGEIDDVFEP